MISLKFDSKAFTKQMNNIMDYSVGFVDGFVNAKSDFLDNLGPEIAELASQFIDTNARVSPETLHHVYEWTKVGSPNARLFDIKYSNNSKGLAFSSNFRQSDSIKSGSTVPFYNKAQIMESGTTVTISPREAQSLVFEVNGETIFTKGPVVVENPGGNVAGEYSNVFDIFFSRYFSQAFLNTSGLYRYFKNPVVYKANLRRGSKSGRSVGLSTGYKWVAGARIGA
jgi:hypothetical protein